MAGPPRRGPRSRRAAPRATTRPTRPRASCSPASGSRLLVDEGSLRRGRPARQRAGRRAARRRRDHRHRPRIDGRPVCLMANDSTVKAGSWGARTVEKIIRIIERAYATGVPMVYLVDSAGARITDQVDLFPGRRGAGQDLPQPGPRVRLDPAGLRAVRAERGRRRLHPGVLRRGRDGRRQRVACTWAPTGWSRWSPARRPRWRRWAGPRCTRAESGVGHFLVQGPSPRRSTWSGATCPTCRPTGSGSRPPAEPRRPGRGRPARAGAGRASGRRSTCAGTSRALLDEDSLLRDPGAAGPAS